MTGFELRPIPPTIKKIKELALQIAPNRGKKSANPQPNATNILDPTRAWRKTARPKRRMRHEPAARLLRPSPSHRTGDQNSVRGKKEVLRISDVLSGVKFVAANGI